MKDDVELIAKLKLDTSEAENQLNGLNSKSSKSIKITAEAEKSLKGIATGSTVAVAGAEMASKSLKDIFSGTSGIVNIGKVAKSATSGINGLSGALFNVTKSAGAIAGVIALATAGIAIIVKMLEGTDTMQAMADEMGNLFEKLKDIMAPVLSLVGDIIIVLTKMVEDVLPLIAPAFDMLALTLKPLVEILKVLEPLIHLVGSAFEFLYDTIKTIIRTLTFGLIDLGNITGSTSVTKKAGYSSSLDVWKTSGATAYDKLDTASNNLVEASDGITAGVDKLYKDTGNWFVKLKDGLIDVGKKSWNTISGIATNVWKGISNIATNVWKGLSNVVSTIGGAVSNVASNIWGGIKNVASNVGNAFVNVFGGLRFWANGGTLDANAQIWGMNERGNPEFLFNSGGTDSVINAEILERAMYNAVKRANADTSAKTLELKVNGSQADARQLVKWILPALKLEWR